MRDTILIVDDSKFNRAMLGDALKDEYTILEAENGKDALGLIEVCQNDLAAILLDVVMPEVGGVELLKIMNEKKYMDTCPVLIVTGEQSLDLVEECFDYGISDFIRKPFNAALVKKRVKKLAQLYMQKNDFRERLEKQTATLRNQYKLLQNQSVQLKKSNANIIDILGTVVEFRNTESKNHIKRIRKFTEIIAIHMMRSYPEYRLTPDQIKMIASASALHDVGKIMIPDSILLKPGKFTEEEFEYMKSHSIRGCDIIDSINGVWDEEYVKCCRDICRYHHEKYDGAGYPDGLKGDEIPISAQIVSIADCYNALISESVYKNAYSLDAAFHMILQGECGVFSDKLLECFRKARGELEEYAKSCQDDTDEVEDNAYYD